MQNPERCWTSSVVNTLDKSRLNGHHDKTMRPTTTAIIEKRQVLP
jgi:hypothetical protein